MSSDAEPSLIFDLGGVIVDHDNALLLDRLGALLDDRPAREDLAAFVAGSGVGNGSVPALGLFARMRDRYGSSATSEQFLDAWSCHFSLNAEVYSLLEATRTARPIVLCSNTNAAHWDFINSRFAIDRLVAKAILSHECGCEKPQAEIYRLAAAAHGREPAACLFVDDLAANVEAAERLGFQTHHFKGVDGLRRALETSA